MASGSFEPWDMSMVSDHSRSCAQSFGVEPQHVGDHDQGERGGDVGDEVAGALLAHAVEDLVADLADAGLRGLGPPAG